MFIFGKKKEGETKSRGPEVIPELVQKHLVAERKMDADLVKLLKAVVHPKGARTFDIRVFDESEALAKKVQVIDYTSLGEHPDLIIYEGWFAEESKRVELEEKKKVSSDTTIFSQDEIRRKIEALTELGSTVFFYLARGGVYGGPLGRGCMVVELNPNYPGEKQKKYIEYMADVVDMQPVGKGQQVGGSDKPKDIAWIIKEVHHKRMY